MSLDEAALRAWVHHVAQGMADRRAFLRYMMGLGLSGPFLSNLLTTYAPAQAQPSQSGAEFVPTKRGGGGKLRLLWWQAPTILNAHLASGGKDLDASRVVYEPLAAFDPDANFVPILATDIPSLTMGGGAGWQVGHLRLKRTWCGMMANPLLPMMSSSPQLAADPATGRDHGQLRTSIISTSSMSTVKSCKELRFWYDAFFGHRGHILPKYLFAQYKGQEARNAPYNLAPVGTGPYKIVEFKPVMWRC
jgi:peptide/nickel transport system substrate-binding protein